MARAKPPRFVCCSASSDRPRARPPSWAGASRQAKAPSSRTSAIWSRLRRRIPTSPCARTWTSSGGSPAPRARRSAKPWRCSAWQDRPIAGPGSSRWATSSASSLARALLHRPELLILDEPANGLDPAGIIEVRELLRRLADENGVTVFMSSHILAEVAHLADRIGIVHEGRLLEELDYDELRSRTRQLPRDRSERPGPRCRAACASASGSTRVERTPRGRPASL